MYRISFFLLLVFFCSSCAVVYVPSARNVPLFTKSGEFNGNLSWGTSGLNVQSAYAVSNHLGVMANFQSDAGNSRTHIAGDIGLGYYLRKKIAFEVYGGYGIGKGYGSDLHFGLDDRVVELDGRYQRLFLQPSLGLYTKRFDWAFTMRVSALYYDELSLQIDRVQMPVPDEPVYAVEPSFTMKYFMADKRLYLLTQMGISGYTKSVKQTQTEFFDVDAEPFQVVLGFGVRLSRK